MTDASCCDEYGCRRRKPYRIRLAPFSQRWVLITDYTQRERGNLLIASRKHDIHDELTRALIAEGWTPPVDVDEVNA